MIIAIASHPLIDLRDLAKTIAKRFGLNYISLEEETLNKNRGLLYDTSKEGVYDNFVFANLVQVDAIKIFLR